MEPVPCLAEWTATGPYAAHVAERRGSGAAPVKMLRLRQPAGAFPDPPSGDLSIQLVTEGAPQARIDFGAGAFEQRVVPGMFCVSPAGTLNSFDVTQAHGIFIAALPWSGVREIVREASERRLSDLGPLHRSQHTDAGVRELLRMLWAAAAEDGPGSRLFADSLAQALVAALVRLALPKRPPARATPLPAWRIRRAQAILSDRLDEEISLEEVAGAVGLSPYHFARGFKAATGMPPHAWRNARRIAHAQRLLGSTTRPIAEIAMACGFCSQAHLTTAFRRAIGATPAAWRRELAV
ncbi:MAG: AraC family transcriptional regulator [Hyphomicrobiaceae bacterium]|nr:AraC family transcriptional regulator [Hyphomicrobiaceae bacterium]